MQKTATIAIDLDEVLAPFVSDLIPWHNQLYQTELKFEQFISYNFSDIWGGSHEQAVAKSSAFHLGRQQEQIQPLAGVRAALALLKQSFSLILLSSRPSKHRQLTQEWVNYHLPNTFADIILCNHWTTDSAAIKKSTMCKELKASYLIDDLPCYAIDAANQDITALLFGNYPWNQHIIPHDNIHRVQNWDAVIEYFQMKKTSFCPELKPHLNFII